MIKKRFSTFGFLLTMGMTTIVFNSYAQKETHDEGVVINGVKWATRNVAVPGIFAANPEDSGMFYQWNRKTGWSVTDPMVNSNGETEWDAIDPEGDTWEKSNDPSPVGWHVPAYDEIKALFDMDKVSREWTTKNDIKGVKFTDKITGNSLFLPIAGHRSHHNGMLNHTNSGFYWSSTLSDDGYAYYMGFGNGRSIYWGYTPHRDVCGDGNFIRPVAE